MPRFWKKISFWNKLKATIGLFGLGGEVIMHIQDSHPVWKAVGLIATGLALAIAIWFEDKNNNGIVDSFENE